MLKDIISADQLSLVISQAAAPAFLLGESPTPGTAVASSPGHPGDLLGGRMRNIVAFASTYVGARHEPAAAVLFTLSLCLFTASMISFAREVRISLNQDELAAEKSQHWHRTGDRDDNVRPTKPRRIRNRRQRRHRPWHGQGAGFSRRYCRDRRPQQDQGGSRPVGVARARLRGRIYRTGCPRRAILPPGCSTHR